MHINISVSANVEQVKNLFQKKKRLAQEIIFGV
jgi:hypothetical protein